MHYRELGKTGKKISIVTLGCMRLPEDDEKGAEVVSRAIDMGMNYMETSPGYCNGRSEIKVGMGIKGRRDKVYISTKSGVGANTTGADTRRQLEGSLKRLGVDKVDFYQLWGFKAEFLDVALAKGGPIDALKKARDEGLLDHIGFTSHDTPENIIRIMETGEFESITVYYNAVQRGPAPAIARAKELGLGVVIMGPLGGGALVSEPKGRFKELLPPDKGPAYYALRFLVSNPAITAAASGMRTVSEVEENAKVGDHPEPLSDEEWAIVTELINQHQKLGEKFCTTCGYCMPCPNGVNIPGNLKLLNYYRVYEMTDYPKEQYGSLDPGERADQCVECEECLEKCPNQIPIIEQLKQVAELLG
jgi:hypothetical protein